MGYSYDVILYSSLYLSILSPIKGSAFARSVQLYPSWKQTSAAREVPMEMKCKLV